MKLEYRVQHLEGRESLKRVLDRIPPAVTVTDRDADAHGTNPLRGYLKCLAPPYGKATHIVVLQDDCVPCNDFGRRITEAVNDRPSDLISLFVGGLTNRTRKDFYAAMLAKERWSPVYFRDIHHVVGLVWPIHEAQAFVEWISTAKLPGPTIPKSDDAAVGYWVRKHNANRDTRKVVWATVPCLVEHPDDVPSTVHSIGRQGDRGRKAIWFE